MDNNYEECLILQHKFIQKNSLYGVTGKPVKDKEFIDKMKRLYDIKENKQCANQLIP